VALKVPHFSDDDGPEVVERFYREARAAAAIHHPNLCPVFEVGQAGGVHYLTMPLNCPSWPASFGSSLKH
jgi:serine/threonine-protein kinase